jgi:hypothetical protein
MITLGADPEVFVLDTDGEFTTGCGKIGGTKHKPLALPREGYFIQEDNVMAEFNVPPVEVTGPEGCYAFGRVIRRAREMVVNHLAERSLVPSWKTCRVEFSQEALEAGGRKALEFGCSPDFDAYNNGAAAPKVDPKEIGTVRYAGGHLHVGHDLKMPPFVLASFLDATVGLTSVAMGDKQGDRRQHYGAPGRFRPTPYGLEYRVLSNYWIDGTDKAETYAHEVYTLFSRLEKATLKDVKRAFAEVPWTDLRRIIVEEDRAMAQRLSSYLCDQVWRTL